MQANSLVCAMGLQMFNLDVHRVWFCTRTWQPEHVRIVGDQRIRGKVCLDLKNRYSGEHLPLLPSDHYGLYTRFRKA